MQGKAKRKKKIDLNDSFQKRIYNKGYRAGRRSALKQATEQPTTFSQKIVNWFWGK